MSGRGGTQKFHLVRHQPTFGLGDFQCGCVPGLLKVETGTNLVDNRYSIDCQPSSHPRALAPRTAAFMLISPDTRNLALPLKIFITCSL